VTEQSRADSPAADQQATGQQARGGADQQSWDVGDCFFELIGNIVTQAEQLAQRLTIPAPFIKALHTLDCPMAMKELGKRMHCDPSFVTLLADMLEKRGLARREPHPADRRIKNIVLTDDGLALKQQVEDELTARMPWNRALSEAERSQLLSLIHKMLSADGNNTDATGASGPEDGAGRLANLIAGALHEHVSQVSHTSPPASTGEVKSAVSDTTVAS
jgi:MarR family transcriptional regulator, organic hydroperoxide resistance regulator